MGYPASALHKTCMNNDTKFKEPVTRLLFRTKDGMMPIPSRVSRSTLEAILQPSAYNTKTQKHAKKKETKSCRGYIYSGVPPDAANKSQPVTINRTKAKDV